MSSHRPADLVFDHALEAADNPDVDPDEAVVELVGLAQGDIATLEQARDLLEDVLAGERSGDRQAGRAYELLDAAVKRAEG